MAKTTKAPKLVLNLEGSARQMQAFHSFLVNRLGEEEWEEGGYSRSEAKWMMQIEGVVAKLLGETPVYSESD